MRFKATAWLIAMPMMVAGCVLAPRGTAEQRQGVEQEGRQYRIPVAQRQLPELPAQPGWSDLLQRAFLANGEIEAAFFEWQAAVSRIDVAAGYPNSNVSLGFEYLFSGGNLKGWDRTTLTVGFDPMQNLSFPTKVLAAGRIAPEGARAAASRLQGVKFALQQRVLTAYFELALVSERLRLQQELVALLRLTESSARARADTGAAQQDVVGAAVELRIAENELHNLEAELPQQRAGLNSLVGRSADSILELPPSLPEQRPIEADDAQLLAIGVVQNPELESLAQAVAGREHALELARLQYLPDVNPFAGISGSMEQVVGAAITLSTMLPQIRGRIVESEALLHASEAALRQARVDRAATYVATLLSLRNNERQAAVVETEILPVALLAADLSRQTYVAGSGMLIQALASQQTVIAVRRSLAEARMAREIRLAELEALAGVDIETVGQRTHVATSGEEGRS